MTCLSSTERKTAPGNLYNTTAICFCYKQSLKEKSLKGKWR